MARERRVVMRRRRVCFCELMEITRGRDVEREKKVGDTIKINGPYSAVRNEKMDVKSGSEGQVCLSCLLDRLADTRLASRLGGSTRVRDVDAQRHVLRLEERRSHTHV
jgi:hypothetical protein